jgi:uncharacterized protein YndB with AHSA1/START domain
MNELRFTRTLEAPRELVFRCMTDPAHLAQFWGPQGVSAPLETITVEARPGGRFETVMVNDTDGSRYQTSAIYDIVDEPATLAWTETATGMKVTIRFDAVGERRTRVDIHQVAVPDAGMEAQARAGFLTALDRFERHLGRLQPDNKGDQR